jgi:hypothetical protein
MAIESRGKALMAAVVQWRKTKNRAYSHAEGRHELFNEKPPARSARLATAEV